MIHRIMSRPFEKVILVYAIWNLTGLYNCDYSMEFIAVFKTKSSKSEKEGVNKSSQTAGKCQGIETID